MTSRPSTAAPILVVLAVVLVTLGRMWAGISSWENSPATAVANISTVSTAQLTLLDQGGIRFLGLRLLQTEI